MDIYGTASVASQVEKSIGKMTEFKACQKTYTQLKYIQENIYTCFHNMLTRTFQ